MRRRRARARARRIALAAAGALGVIAGLIEDELALRRARRRR